MNVIVIKPNNTYSIVDTDGNIKDLQNLVGGYVEPVRPTAAYVHAMLKTDNLFLCDEEGLLKEKAFNRWGTMMYNGISEKIHPVVGDIVIIGESEEDFRGLSNDEISYYRTWFKFGGIEEVCYEDIQKENC
ncbi:MAG: DUF3846 domain-containing protein [Clostridium sp.]